MIHPSWKAYALACGLSCLAGSALAQDAVPDSEATFSAVATPATDMTADTITRVSQPSRSSNANTGSVGGSDSEQFDAILYGRKGLLLTYGDIRRRAQKSQSGDIVKVRLNKRDNKRWIYEVTVLSDKGLFTLLSLDARTGRLLSRKKL